MKTCDKPTVRGELVDPTDTSDRYVDAVRSEPYLACWFLLCAC
jgi:hypothetical protein